MMSEITTVTLSQSASAVPMKLAAALWERLRRLTKRTPRRLRLCESLPLGERRFVAVVEFDSARFLVGGTASSLVMLSRLDGVGIEDGKLGNVPQDDSRAAGTRRGEPC